ncbi:N-acetyltransferase [Alkalimonas amylolytica]|uniref:N-acetyltransferase n=1 Tax=Alkalimonas amylolytica TaxID=152573 RepID=A0A1H4DWB1_ALKAM|nr:N-acetyltransferase [Alkalimonas amylolytica]SEA76798.1 hypothetical protein SAMN04488051_10665 [Alkalimonas amylolytica]
MESLHYLPFREINLQDSFFDTLRADYAEFPTWFSRKSEQNEFAYVLVNGPAVDGFMYLKNELGPITDVSPNLSPGRYLKVGTFKFNSQGTRRGEKFIKKIFDHALSQNVDSIYVTVFDKHHYLRNLFAKYGFTVHGVKSTLNGTESVMVRSMRNQLGSTLSSYPFVKLGQSRSYLLSIYPQFHSRMLPDSILNNETHDVIQDVSHTNSIHKIYICGMDLVSSFRPGDNLILYRTSDKPRLARFRSVATSIGVVEEYRNIREFESLQAFLAYCSPYSVFTNDELMQIYHEKRYCHVIRFTYNAALCRRITRGHLLDEVGLNEGEYWGAMQLTNQQFRHIASLGGINESLIVD